ncbi:hypothetical protein MAPG_01333 [Magnaporthiopsis poae ATCC 64411]|uniref:Uncharacterized protein n=1 Tax=Magnaporthiopsis poae (strain ATCC 64411 / 73-15) TaxID=644358 RepID=A0A0C4DNF2_MAGP6|nr:hypothetical protein MAPG_01333 [Magnaporthiopsis poae ATCC 64411]
MAGFVVAGHASKGLASAVWYVLAEDISGDPQQHPKLVRRLASSGQPWRFIIKKSGRPQGAPSQQAGYLKFIRLLPNFSRTGNPWLRRFLRRVRITLASAHSGEAPPYPCPLPDVGGAPTFATQAPSLPARNTQSDVIDGGRGQWGGDYLGHEPPSPPGLTIAVPAHPAIVAENIDAAATTALRVL